MARPCAQRRAWLGRFITPFVPQGVPRNCVDQCERVVAEPREHRPRHDQAVRFHLLTAALAIPAQGHGPRDAERPAGQRMEVQTLRLGAGVQQAVVRRPPDGQLAGVRLAEPGTGGHDLIAGRTVAAAGHRREAVVGEDRLFCLHGLRTPDQGGDLRLAVGGH